MNLIWRANRWFDDLKEPNRFFFFLLIIATPLAIIIAMPASWSGLPEKLFGVLVTAALISMRWFWLRKD